MVGLTDACYFCGAGEDSAEHVYGECAVVREARRRWAVVLGCKLGDAWEVTLLAFTGAFLGLNLVRAPLIAHKLAARAAVCGCC